MTLEEWLKRLEQKVSIVVGYPKGKQVTYPPDDRKGRSGKGGQTVAQVAAWNEFGTKNIPKRPFLSYALKKNKNRITQLMTGYFLPKNLNNSKYLDSVGIELKNMVIRSILDGPWKANSQATIDMKKSNAPLVDRGIMKNNVNYEVKVE